MNRFDGKKILIWGYGREGKSSERFFINECKAASVEIFEGKIEDIDIDKYDVIVKSPGIVMEGDNPKFTSQTEIFLEKYKKQVIGITGTKGKSTTSTMLYTVLSKCTDRQVILLGNIGYPCLDYYNGIDNDGIIVFEMSCHQLCHNLISPHIGIFLNLFEEHLDYYKSLEKYFAAKSRIALYQEEGDIYYHGSNVPYIETPAKEVEISSEKSYDFDLSIEGEHNKYNAEFVFRIATELFECDPIEVRKAIKEFTGLSHRLEYVNSINGVRYFDDSISTIPEATISAALSIKDSKTLLIGGMDRGIDYSKLEDFIKRHDEFNFILMYASGERIFSASGIKDLDYVYYEKDLEGALKKAYQITDTGAVILSPAAASYGYFKNFEERGDAFKEMVNRLSL